ncbi:hypothetical protein BOX07_gp33 [Pseudoalteromonas phage PH1]|uniref:hypothetical protein n=1 Tax=Pseudoalteromonas phage PH1 TaxID=1874540 RepID=UPI0008198C3F|nr:hypothetical protein BOX07_gp33 [Pseudoalteromonas phage PH1]ANY29544.1 hypothetical protein [Pseudoalteromonas phage PH1]
MSINKQGGICTQDHISKAQIVKLRKLLQDRGWYSGDIYYPIEHPTEAIDPQLAYWRQAHNLWDEDCPYCQRRITIYKELIACSNAS